MVLISKAVALSRCCGRASGARSLGMTARTRRARSTPAAIPRALRPARPRGGALVERRPDAFAFRGGSGELPVRSVSAAASAMVGSTKGELRQVELARPARARPTPAEILRALSLARQRGGVLLASGVPAQPDEGVGRAAAASSPPALAPRRREFCERFGRHAREAAGCLRGVRAQPDEGRVQRRPGQATSRQPLRAMAGSPWASYGGQNCLPRTRSPHAGGNTASASAGTPAKRRAACVRRSCAAKRGARCAAVGAAVRSVPAALRRWLDRPRASYGSQTRVAPPAPDPRRRTFCERFGTPARRRAACVRRSCAARPGRSAAVRATWRCARARSTPAEILRALRAARPRRVGLLA